MGAWRSRWRTDMANDDLLVDGDTDEVGVQGQALRTFRHEVDERPPQLRRAEVDQPRRLAIAGVGLHTKIHTDNVLTK